MMSFFTSLRFRLILIVLLAVIPAMIITYITGLEQRRLAKINAEADALRLAQVIAGYQESILEGARQLTTALSLVSWNPVENPERCASRLLDLHQRFPMYSSLNVTAPDGRVLCSTVQTDDSMSLAGEVYFDQAIQNRGLAIGKATVGRLTQHIVVPVANVIQDSDGNVTGLLVVGIDLQAVVDLTKTLALPPGSVLLMLGSDNTVLVRYPEIEGRASRELPSTAVVRAILSQPEEGQVEAEGLDGVNRLYAFTPVKITDDYRLAISVGIPTSVVYAAADKAILRNLIWISIIALLALAVAWFVGDRLFLKVVSLTTERDKAEERLRGVNQQLELRVAERTKALDEANVSLNTELEERKRTLQQLHEREIELERMLAMLEKSNRELESFAYITSHDLQEPLRKIQAFGERLSKNYSEGLGEEGTDFIQRMRSAANRMQVMVNDLLTYSRLTTRAGEFVEVDLNLIADEVIEDLEVRIMNSGGQVIVEPLPKIAADATQMRQLLQNLIVNGLKFHRRNVSPIVKISCQGQADSVHPEGGEHPAGGHEISNHEIQLIVEDNGIGFDEKYAERIFLPFQRLHSQDVFEGTGIGLAICRKIAERHGGTITAQSTPGVGSRFIIRLPRFLINVEGELHE